MYNMESVKYTNLRTPWNRNLLEKLTVTQLLKKFPDLYATRRFIIVYTRPRHWSLYWARGIYSTSPNLIP